MSTAIDMPQADARLPRTTVTAGMPQDAVEVSEAAEDDENNEIKPWWAYLVEFFVIPMYWIVRWLWPSWIWDRRGVRDQEIYRLDTELYWTREVRLAMDYLAYPLVRVPDDLNAIERIIWCLKSWDWWTVRSWIAVCNIKWFWLIGPQMAPPFGIDPYNVQMPSHL